MLTNQDRITAGKYCRMFCESMKRNGIADSRSMALEATSLLGVRNSFCVRWSLADEIAESSDHRAASRRLAGVESHIARGAP